MSNRALLTLAADITAAYAARHRIPVADIPAVMRAAFAALGAPDEAPPPVLKPAVPIRDSIKPDYIVCLEDGRRLKVLRGHLRSAFNMTPEQYRAKWRLRSDYPMVAPNYSMVRSKLALACGLGRSRSAAAARVKVA